MSISISLAGPVVNQPVNWGEGGSRTLQGVADRVDLERTTADRRRFKRFKELGSAPDSVNKAVYIPPPEKVKAEDSNATPISSKFAPQLSTSNVVEAQKNIDVVAQHAVPVRLDPNIYKEQHNIDSRDPVTDVRYSVGVYGSALGVDVNIAV